MFLHVLGIVLSVFDVFGPLRTFLGRCLDILEYSGTVSDVMGHFRMLLDVLEFFWMFY